MCRPSPSPLAKELQTPYYALIKANVSRVGLWPEQSKYEKMFLPLTILAIILTLVGPMFIRIHEVWGDLNSTLSSANEFLLILMAFTCVLNIMLKADKIEMLLEDIQRHWKRFTNTPAMIILEKYAKCGHYLAIVYPVYVYTTVALYIMLTMSPIMMDFVDPLNKTRPKVNLLHVSYGADLDKYYWFTLAHCSIVSILVLSMAVAVEAIYISLIVHACSIFKVVQFNLKLATVQYVANGKESTTVDNDRNYQNTCDCIIVHNEAISFTEQIESIFCLSTLLMVGTATVLMSFTGIQIMINLEEPAMLMRALTFALCEVFNFYFNSLPGQQLMDHSQNIHALAYDLDWHDLPIRSQKLWILILMRSGIPCRLTAGKIYIFSIESFGTVLKTSLSYFIIFANLL